MKKVAVITDSASCLPGELIHQYGVMVVPLRLIIEGKVYRDGVDITPDEVYSLQRANRILPTTSAPSPGEFLEVYRAASADADALLSISISHKFSMVFSAASQARDMAREALPGVRIEVLDARTAAGAQGFLVLAAARAVAAGSDVVQAIEEIERLRPRVNMVATVDTLHFLARGGRMPQAAAWAGSMLSIKPIIHVTDEAVPLEKIRTKPRATRRLIEIMEERSGRKGLHVNIMHAGVPDEAENLKRQILDWFECREIFVTEFPPVIGVHTGPGTIGLAFYRDE